MSTLSMIGLFAIRTRVHLSNICLATVMACPRLAYLATEATRHTERH
jgi:hypothetical protein